MYVVIAVVVVDCAIVAVDCAVVAVDCAVVDTFYSSFVIIA